MSLVEARKKQTKCVRLFGGDEGKSGNGHSTGGTLFNHVRLGQAAEEMRAESEDESKGLRVSNSQKPRLNHPGLKVAGTGCRG